MEEKRKQSYIDTDSTHAKRRRRRSGREKETELYIDTGSTHAKRISSAQDGLGLDERYTVTVCVLDVDEHRSRVDEIEVVSYVTSP